MLQHLPLQGGSGALQSPATCQTPMRSGQRAGGHQKVCCKTSSLPSDTLVCVVHLAYADAQPVSGTGWWEDPAISTAAQAFEIFDASLEKHRHLSELCRNQTCNSSSWQGDQG